MPARRKGKGVSENLTGGLFKSTDGAESWKRISSPEMYRTICFAVHPEDQKIIYVAAMDGLGHTGGVYKTTDGGATWANLNVAYDKERCGYIEGYS